MQESGNQVQETDQAAEATQAVEATQESLDQVRDILFGSQLRQQDNRFSQLEEKIGAELNAFRAEQRKQMDTLREFVQGEFAAVASRMTAEAQQRADAVGRVAEEGRSADRAISEKLEQQGQRLSNDVMHAAEMVSNEWKNARGALESRLTAAEQQQAAVTAEMRTSMFDTTNRLRDESKNCQADLQAMIEKVVAELRSAKTDRSALAGLFAEMAGKLQG